jgi:hypothetical protein
VDEDNARADPDDAKALVAGLQELSDGSYTVEWRVTSLDGHVIDGTYQFAVVGAGGSPATQSVNNDVEKPDSTPQESAEGGSIHVVHGAILGLGTLVILAMALLRRR